MKTDVVVIGGGIAGLATGALVARQGRSVVVLEKGNQPGGRAYTIEEKAFTLNYGPHAVYRPTSGVLAEILARIGQPQLPFGKPRASRSFWADGDRFGAVSDKPHEVLFNKDIFPAATRLRFAKVMAKVRFGHFDGLGEMTFSAWVERETDDAILRRWLLALATVNTYTRPAAALSAKFLLQHLQRNMFAKDYVGYLHGGWRRIYESFIAALERDGGRLATGVRVQRLETDGGRVVAAVTDDERYEAEAFVSTLPPADAPALAGEGTALHDELAQWASIDDVRALCMDLGFARRLRDDLSYVFDVERDLYFSLHSEVSPDLAPPGAQLLHAMAYLSPEEAADDAARARRKDELVGGLDRFFAGWREALVVERTLPNALVASARQTPEGMRQRVPLRSSVAANLYFANDARESALNLSEISLASAVEAADAIGVALRAAKPAPAVA
jgi:phytoene dehydrogenase-like protein